MPRSTSQHILGTSANLLGFCLFVITAFHISNRAQNTIIDEFTGAVGVMLAVSCIFSFASIRSQKEQSGNSLERIAEIIFLFSLIGILVIIVFITLRLIR